MTAYQTENPGFRIFENVLSAEECETILSSLSNSKVTKGRAGARHLMGMPEVARIASDPRLVDIARRLLRTEPFPFRATLFDKSGEANWLVVWHQDTSLPFRKRFDARHGDRGQKRPVSLTRMRLLRRFPASWLYESIWTHRRQTTGRFVSFHTHMFSEY